MTPQIRFHSLSLAFLGQTHLSHSEGPPTAIALLFTLLTDTLCPRQSHYFSLYKNLAILFTRLTKVFSSNTIHLAILNNTYRRRHLIMLLFSFRPKENLHTFINLPCSEPLFRRSSNLSVVAPSAFQLAALCLKCESWHGCFVFYVFQLDWIVIHRRCSCPIFQPRDTLLLPFQQIQ